MSGEDEGSKEAGRKAVIREVDAALLRGETPDISVLEARFPSEVASIGAIVAMRRALFDEGMLGAADDETEDASGEGGQAEELADLQSEFQDALNRGARPDLGGLVEARPELREDVNELSRFYDFMAEALKSDFTGPTPEPVQEVVLSHFRLVTMHAKHPLGGLFLGVDQHTGRHVEVLVIRGQMSRARGNRLLREASIARATADPGIVPVVEAGHVHDMRFIAWEHRAELTLDRVIRRLRRGGGARVLHDVIAEHSDSGRSEKPQPPSVGGEIEGAAGAASRLLRNPAHVASLLGLLAAAGEALDRAHLRGMLLVDVRPANVWVDRRGGARLRGFGLVQSARAAWHRLGSETTFLAPEVLADDEPAIDWRADIYGLATLSYALLTLSEPPDFASMGDRSERLFMDLRGAPEALLKLLDRALSKDPASRPDSCGIMADEFRVMAATLRPDAGAAAPAPAPAPAWAWYAFLTFVLLVVVTAILLSYL